MKRKKKKLSTRQKAARRTAAGEFNKAVFKEIGGKECPRYAALTWKERDKIHSEIPAVKARYDRHIVTQEVADSSPDARRTSSG